MSGPLYRGQGNAAYRTSQPEKAARRGQTVPYENNGAPTGATVNDNSITDAKLADMPQATIKGRAAGAGTGDPQNLSAGQVKTILALTASDISGLGYFATGTDAAQLTGTVAAARLPQFTGGDVTTGGAGSVNLTIGANTVTDTKLRDSAALSVIGRSANTSGDPGDIAAASDGDVLRRSGTTLGFGQIATAGITDGAVTLAKQANVATATVFYRKSASSGPPEVQTLATLKTDLGLTGTNSGDQTITLTGDVTGSGTGSFVTAIGANKVTDAMLRQSAGLSIIGRASNTTGNVADITAANDGEVLRRSGTAVGFGTIATAGITDGAVTLAKQASVATATVFYRKTAGTGAPEVQTLATLKTDLGLTGTNSGDQTITLTGDVTGSGTGSFAATIAANVVSDAKLRQSAGLSVIGRSANTTGNVADLTGTAGQVLRVSGTTLGFGSIDLSLAATVGTTRLAYANLAQGSARSVLGVTGNTTADVASIQGTADQVLVVNGAGTALAFGTVATGGITAKAVTYAKIQDVSATDKLLGRQAAGAGVVEEITCTAAGRALIDDADAAAQRTTLGVNFRGAMAKKSADQVGADYSTGATVAFDAEVYDTSSFHDLVTNNSRLSVPSGVSYVQVGATITFGNVTIGTDVTVIIRKNGVTSYDGVAQDQRDAATAAPCVNLCSGVIPVVGGTDYFELVVFMQTDTSVDITAARTNFWIRVVE